MEDDGMHIRGLEYEFGDYVDSRLLWFVCGVMIGKYNGELNMTYNEYMREVWYIFKTNKNISIPRRVGYYSHKHFIKWLKEKNNG